MPLSLAFVPKHWEVKGVVWALRAAPPQWSSSMANMDTGERRGREVRQEQRKYQAIFYKHFWLITANYGLCLFIFICKWYVNEDKIIMFFLIFACLLFLKYQPVNFSQKFFLMSQGTCQIGCKTAATGMSQAECKLSICCTGLMVPLWLYTDNCNHKMLKGISTLLMQKVTPKNFLTS